MKNLKTTMFVDCGLLGEEELTICFDYIKGFKGTYFEPPEPETIEVNWIKIGGEKGYEVTLSDDFIKSEVIPVCFESMGK